MFIKLQLKELELNAKHTKKHFMGSANTCNRMEIHQEGRFIVKVESKNGITEYMLSSTMLQCCLVDQIETQ